MKKKLETNIISRQAYINMGLATDYKNSKDNTVLNLLVKSQTHLKQFAPSK